MIAVRTWLGLAVALAPAPALADRPFILPSNTLYSGDGTTATFDAAGSDHVFFFDHRPLALETIRVVRPDGSPGEMTNATRTRFRSVFDVRLDRQGTWKVASAQTMVGGTVRIGGEERRVGGRGGPPPGAGPAPGMERGGERGMRDGGPGGGVAAAGGGAGAPGGERRPPTIALADLPADATDLHLTETVARTETFVTDGAPTEAALAPTGKGLEMQPITHPNAVVAGETARFRFLIDGRPAPGVAVTVLAGGDRYREAADAMRLSTGADGVVAVRWPAAGMYWLGAEAEDAHPAEKRAGTRRMTYAATLEVMTP